MRAAPHLRNLRNLRRTVLGGGPDPAPLLAPTHPVGLGRAVRILLMVAAALLALYTVWYEGTDSGPQIVMWTLSVAPLALVSDRPLLAWRLCWLLGTASLLSAVTMDGMYRWTLYDGVLDWLPAAWGLAQVVVFLVVLFAVGTAQHRGVLLWVWLASTALTVAGVRMDDRFPGLNAPVTAALLVTGVLMAGYLIRLGAWAQHKLAVAQEQGSVLTERARIARELHDVVAHHVSMIAVRAETAPYRLAALPEPARIELAEISQASRQALTEMRRLLGVLRSGDAELPVAPQPGVADLPELVRAAGAAGSNEITLDIDPELPELPAGVDVSVYRIVQEALTNAARHAPGAPVRVLVGRTTTGVSVSVRNGPGRTDVVAQRGPGHGLRGMRERAGMLGGELSAMPTAERGFEVLATLPVSR